MTKRKYNNILILVLFSMYIIYYKIFIAASQLQYSEFINVAVISIISFIAILLLGYRKDKLTPLKKSILAMTITEIIIFFIASYGLGLVTGFLKNSYALNFFSIFDNIFAPIIYVIAIEIFRYTVLNANSDSKLVIYLTTILITILELSMGLSDALMYNFETTFKVTSSIILPIIIKNASLSYITIHGGLKSTLVYRLIMDIYMYVMPIVPDLGEYITSVIGILLPTLVYMYASRLVDESHKENAEVYTKKSLKLSDIPMILFIIVLVGLISGNFSYALIGVGSGSMSPKIEKGDAVIYKKVKDSSELKKGDILVFQNGSKIIIHRLVDKVEDDGSVYYVTKGDANNANDSLHLTMENIKGKVLFKIKYLAYPNLFLKDLIDKE